MLESLHVKNLALIDEAEVEFYPGLNILTGETGAGKSILLGSIQLALGEKADKDMIRDGADYALVELVFRLDEETKSRYLELELPMEEDNIVILQRKIMPQRSVSKVCGESVSAKELRKLGEMLINIHGQKEHQVLLETVKQKEILDAYAGEELAEKMIPYKALYEEYMELSNLLSEKEMDEETKQKEISLLEFECKEIEGAGLIDGEDSLLEAKFQKMNNARKLSEIVSGVYEMISGDHEYPASMLISKASREIKNAMHYDSQLEDIAQSLADMEDVISEVSRSLSGYMSGLEFDEMEYRQTQERLDVINHLKDRYGATISDVLAYLEDNSRRLEQLADYDQYLKSLQDKKNQLETKLYAECKCMHDIRTRYAKQLSLDIKAALIDLNFSYVAFEIRVEDKASFGIDGADEIEWWISTNEGESIKPMSGVASGGELSRIMLAVKTVIANKDELDTLIFDEIDAGISGKTAWKVSAAMGALAGSHQILCITHLPQIAAMADHHFCIEKEVVDGRTITRIYPLNQEEEMDELARLLGAGVITDSVLANARDMKEQANQYK